MQSTGQASTQAVSLVPMHGSAITYAIRSVVSLTYAELNGTAYSSKNGASGTGPVRDPAAGKSLATESAEEHRGNLFAQRTLRLRASPSMHHRLHKQIERQPCISGSLQVSRSG